MQDKERILMCLVNYIYRQALFGIDSVQKWRDLQPSFRGDRNPLEAGDLVVASTTITPNEFMVGYVEEICHDYIVIREIGSKNTVNYYNEMFYRIDKNILGYEILEGTQYEIYKKVLKAFSKIKKSYTIRFQSIDFNERICTVKARKVFSDETVGQISFEYNSKTSIKSIISLLDDLL